METTATITNIQKFSVHDGPGIRSVIFFKGCPLACEWCANPENISDMPELMVHPDKCISCGACVNICPQQAIYLAGDAVRFLREKCINCDKCANICNSQSRILKGQLHSVDQVMQRVDKDLPFYKNSGGGITFSGGEPLLHARFIREIAKNYKDKGLNSAIETCGHVPWESFEMVKPWIDLFLFDLKFVNEQKHKRYCKKGNELILTNLEKLCEHSKVIIRMPIIPGINDSERDLTRAADFLSRIKSRIQGVHCLPYHNLGLSKYDALGVQYKLSDVKVPKDDYLNHVKERLERCGVNVQVGG